MNKHIGSNFDDFLETDLFKVSSENMKEIDTVLNTDDLPVLEFSVARNIYD